MKKLDLFYLFDKRALLERISKHEAEMSMGYYEQEINATIFGCPISVLVTIDKRKIKKPVTITLTPKEIEIIHRRLMHEPVGINNRKALDELVETFRELHEVDS